MEDLAKTVFDSNRNLDKRYKGALLGQWFQSFYQSLSKMRDYCEAPFGIMNMPPARSR